MSLESNAKRQWSDKDTFDKDELAELWALGIEGYQCAMLAAREIEQLNVYAYALECALLYGFSNSDEVAEMLTTIREQYAPDVKLASLSERVFSEIEKSDGSRWNRLFGTPERAAHTLITTTLICEQEDRYCEKCPFFKVPSCYDYDELLEWLRGGEKNGA